MKRNEQMPAQGCARFTPGPWFSDGRDIHFDGSMGGYTRVNGVVASTRPGPFRVVGASGLSTSITPEEEGANAALLAAAPEMYEACRIAYSALLGAPGPADESTLQLLSDAIMKAEGR